MQEGALAETPAAFPFFDPFWEGRQLLKVGYRYRPPESSRSVDHQLLPFAIRSGLAYAKTHFRVVTPASARLDRLPYTG